MKPYAECLADLNAAKELEAAVRRVEEALTTLTRLRDETRALADRIGAEGVSYSIFDSTVIALKDAERFVAARRAEAADAYYRENVEAQPFTVGDRVEYTGAFDDEFTGTVVRVDGTDVHVRRDDGDRGGGVGGSWVTPARCLRRVQP